MQMSNSNSNNNNSDKQFLLDMIKHHQMALTMSSKIYHSTQNQTLKQFASQIYSAQSQEIEKMKGWLLAWYGVRV